MSRSTYKVELVHTTRTDLICIRCGGFRTELAVVPAPGCDEHVGMHKACARGGKRGVSVPVKVTSLAEGRFPTPRLDITVDAAGHVSAVNEYGEEVGFTLVPIDNGLSAEDLALLGPD